MPSEWDEMDEAQPDPYWASFHDGGYTLELEDEDEPVGERDGPLVGVLTSIDQGVGENESNLYTVRTEVDPRPVKFWGSSSIDRQFSAAMLEPGDEVGVLKTGEEIDTGKGNPMQEYDVRYSKA